MRVIGTNRNGSLTETNLRYLLPYNDEISVGDWVRVPNETVREEHVWLQIVAIWSEADYRGTTTGMVSGVRRRSDVKFAESGDRCRKKIVKKIEHIRRERKAVEWAYENRQRIPELAALLVLYEKSGGVVG